MPIENDEYVPRSRETEQEVLAEQLLSQQPNANPRAPSTYTWALLYSVAATIAQEQEQDLKTLYNSIFVRDATGAELTKKAENLGVRRREAKKATGVVTFSRSSDASQDYVVPAGTIVETLEEEAVQFETVSDVTLSSGTQEVDVTVEALDGGADGNVGPNAIQSIPSKPTGVETVTNKEPTGDPTLTDTRGEPLREGRNRENDEELRKRVLNTDATAEAPSAPGIRRALTPIDGLRSVKLIINETNGVVDGLDPYSTEVVAFGGDSVEIAQTLRDVLSVTTLLRLQGGVNGTKVTETVTAKILDQDITVELSRPEKTNLDVAVDVVHTSAYAGDSEASDAVVNYIGGTYANNSTTTGVGIGKNVLVNEIENQVEDVAGVDYAEVTLLDADDDGTDDTTTDSEGVPIYDVSEGEVTRIDADNVTINTTAR
jgi:uncharacterized phage protein gp47/JayE